jgi:hypothetical protein
MIEICIAHLTGHGADSSIIVVLAVVASFVVLFVLIYTRTVAAVGTHKRSARKNLCWRAARAQSIVQRFPKPQQSHASASHGSSRSYESRLEVKA